LCLAAAVHAQAPAFDVVSIRPNPAATSGGIRPTPNGQLTATGVTLRALILRAHGVHDVQLLGAPAWADTERFDIDARVQPPPEGGPEALMLMLRTLLTDRFRLKAHSETRELSAYVLVHARADRRLGSQIRPTVADCTRTMPLTQAEMVALANGWPPCGQASSMSWLTDDPVLAAKLRVRLAAFSMQQFARSLQSTVNRPVVDQTDLPGRFDIEYSYARSPSASSPGAPADSNLPTQLVALEEQLGLKLEARRTPVPVLVIDSVERPAAN
jgi:uncharacterized protein (TIGR03435 family)